MNNHKRYIAQIAYPRSESSFLHVNLLEIFDMFNWLLILDQNIFNWENSEKILVKKE